MSVEKEPLTDEEFSRMLKVATKLEKESSKGRWKDAKKVLLLIRYTGMHVSILCSTKDYNLRIEENNIIWNRTKKKGKEAHTFVRISSNIDFDVKEFIKDLRNRKKRNNRQYFYDLIKDIGERAGISDVSPMSLRHTVGIAMLDAGYPEAFVQQKLNCTAKTLKTYLKYSRKRSNDLFDKIGW